MKKAVSKQKRSAQAALFDMTKPIQKKVLIAVKESLKDVLANDPGMCYSLQRAIRKAVDSLWEDVELEVSAMATDCRHNMEAGNHAWKTVEKLRAVGQPPAACSFKAFRAWFLYYSLPFDKSLFGCLAEPRYWIFIVWSMIPDVRVAYYAVLLILFNMPGPPDEYLLVQFIVSTKTTQFLSSGIGLAFLGGLQYYMCVGEQDHHTCAKNGPGTSTSALSGAIDIVGTSALVWASFLLLPYSLRVEGPGARRQALTEGMEPRSSAGHEDEHHDDTDSDEEEHCVKYCFPSCIRCCCPSGKVRAYDSKRGGRLANLLKYEIWSFLIATVFLFVISLKHIHNRRIDQGIVAHVQSWQFQSTLYWARVFYSFLALPFVVFSIPILTSILTHTLPTGYNLNGVVVESMLPPLEHEEDRQAAMSSQASSWSCPSA